MPWDPPDAPAAAAEGAAEEELPALDENEATGDGHSPQSWATWAAAGGAQSPPKSPSPPPSRIGWRMTIKSDRGRPTEVVLTGPLPRSPASVGSPASPMPHVRTLGLEYSRVKISNFVGAHQYSR